MAEKFLDGRSDRMMPSSSEDFVLQLTMVIAIFIPLGFVGRLFTNYLIGSGWFISSVAAVAGTLLSVIIFVPLGRYTRLSKTLMIGFLANTALLLILFSFVWKPDALTLKYSGVYLFRDGNITGAGFLYYLPFSLWESAISCLDFAIYARLSDRLKGDGRCPHP